ncbi:MAG: hypothetical protein ACN4GG_11225 [Akkermansiaceae bacterium]
MKFKPLPLVSALLLATSLSSSAKDGADAALSNKAYLLATKEYIPTVGTVREDKKAMLMKGAKMQLNISGQIMEGSMTMKDNEQEKYEILAADKIRYTLVQKDLEQKMIFMDQPMPIPAQPSPLVETPVIFTKKDGAWSGALEEGGASVAQKDKIKDLEDAFNQDADFKVYGDTPRKVGDEWEVDAADIMGDDELEGKIKVKFSRVEMFEGKNCAVIEGNLDLTGQPEEMAGATLKMVGKLTIHRSLADKTDISTKMDGSMSMIGKMEPQPGMAVDMKVKGAMTMNQTTTLRKAQ